MRANVFAPVPARVGARLIRSAAPFNRSAPPGGSFIRSAAEVFNGAYPLWHSVGVNQLKTWTTHEGSVV
jgi:hypothetical protein